MKRPDKIPKDRIICTGARRLARPDCFLCAQLEDLFKDQIGTSHQNLAQPLQYDHICLWYRVATDDSYRGYLALQFWSFYTIIWELHIFPEQSALRVSEHKVNLNQAKVWLDHCLSDHTEPDRVTPANRSSSFQFIDYLTRKLCLAPSDSPYVCLSYVWGSVTEAQRRSSDDLEDPPKTISDAMLVTLNLGIRFLWVDWHCLGSSSADDKHDAIRKMGAIYQGATITIFAVAGEGPNYGLPGVNGTPLSSTFIQLDPRSYHGGPNEQVRSVRTIENPYYEIVKSKWNTRGWTYQELLLSRRCLFFTNTQMYFQCMNMQCQERVETSGINRAYPRLKYNIDSIPEYIPRVPRIPKTYRTYSLTEFYNRLEEYYPRKLTFRTDCIEAFLGILNNSTSSDLEEATHFYGLPLMPGAVSAHTATKSFVDSLMWMMTDN